MFYWKLSSVLVVADQLEDPQCKGHNSGNCKGHNHPATQITVVPHTIFAHVVAGIPSGLGSFRSLGSFLCCPEFATWRKNDLVKIEQISNE